LLGRDAGGLSASTIGRLKEAWCEEHARWSKRDLSAKRYIYFWVDGIHVQARLEDTAQCLLIIIGATPEGRKELVGLTDGVRESAQSWRELLLDLERHGLSIGPELAVADGALGFWQAVEEIWPQTRGQRCWVHKTANVLNKLPNSQQPKAKRALQEIWMAETKKDALAAFDAFIETWGVKYDKAVECLIKDRDALHCSTAPRRPISPSQSSLARCPIAGLSRKGFVPHIRPPTKPSVEEAGRSGRMRTAMPRPAVTSRSSKFWTIHPAAFRSASISRPAFCSGLSGIRQPSIRPQLSD
jgi:hypothetical protein